MSTILELAFAACQKLSVPQNIVLCHEINPNALWAEQKKSIYEMEEKQRTDKYAFL